MAEESNAKKPVRRRRAASPPAGEGGIHQLAQSATQQAESIKTGEVPEQEEVSAPAVKEDNPDTPEAIQEPAGEFSRQEIKKSGLTSGNPEIKNDSQDDDDESEEKSEAPFDYLEASYGGITPPEDDFVKGSTQLPKYVWKALKAAAVMQQVPMQQLLRDIVLGNVPPLPQVAPAIERKFYRMAQEGKLKN